MVWSSLRSTSPLEFRLSFSSSVPNAEPCPQCRAWLWSSEVLGAAACSQHVLEGIPRSGLVWDGSIPRGSKGPMHNQEIHHHRMAEAYLYVILGRLPGAGVMWTPAMETTGWVLLPSAGVLLLAGQDTEEPQSVGELHCPSSSTSSQPLPINKMVLRVWEIYDVYSWGCLWCPWDASDISAFLRLFFRWINFHFAKVASSCEALDRHGWR